MTGGGEQQAVSIGFLMAVFDVLRAPLFDSVGVLDAYVDTPALFRLSRENQVCGGQLAHILLRTGDNGGLLYSSRVGIF